MRANAALKSMDYSLYGKTNKDARSEQVQNILLESRVNIEFAVKVPMFRYECRNGGMEENACLCCCNGLSPKGVTTDE